MTTEKQHIGLRGRKLQGTLLTFLLDAQDDELRACVKDAADGLASRTLVKQGPLRITQVALHKGAALGSHHVTGSLSILVLRGTLRLMTAEGDTDLAAGSLARSRRRTRCPGAQQLRPAANDQSAVRRRLVEGVVMWISRYAAIRPGSDRMRRT